MYSRLGKRVFDVLVSSSAIVCLSPLMLLIAAAIRLGDRGPAFFRQERVGSGGRLFTLLKFRSMPPDTANLPSNQAKDVRITAVGRLIRRTNLDELPQLINILCGDMSVVGPRPALPSQIELTESRMSNGAIVCRPGLTGLAQINAYNGMPVEQKARWDGRYAAGIRFASDLWIILLTFQYLLKPPPVY